MTDDRIRVGIVVNSFVSGRGAHSGGFIHITEVAKRWSNADVVFFGPEDARVAVARAVPGAAFVASRPRALPAWMSPTVANAIRLAGTIAQRRALATCDVVIAGTGFLADVMPTLLARRGRAALVVQHLQTVPWKRRGSLAANAFAYATERLGLGPARLNVRLVFFNDERDLRSIGIDRTRVRAVRLSHGVDHLHSSPEALPASARDGALYVGRIHATKGMEDLVRAWALVVAKRPHERLRIIGSGDDGYRQWLEELVARLGLEQNVEFLGACTDDRKARELARARAFVFPSFEEGFGIAVAEALLFGTPTVTYDLDIYRDIFTGGRIEVRRRDVPALAAGVLELLDDDERWDVLSREGRALAHSFTWQRAADVYDDALRELIAT